MKKSQRAQADIAELRRRAEERLKEQTGDQVGNGEKPFWGENSERLIHELNVHQIEMEMQNEELLQSRAEVEEGLALYAELYDFAPVGYFTFDRDGAIRRSNLTGARLLGLERGRLAGWRFGHFLSEAGRPAFNAFLKKVFASREKETCEAELYRGEESPAPYERLGSRFLGETGRLMVSIEAIAAENGQECRAVMTDITERKKAEEKIQASLREKETLLKEIHHRVKNNLQIVSSLLTLQSGYLKDPQAVNAFMESRNRINTIAMVHANLYQSENLAAIDYADFIRDLAGSLLYSCGKEPSAVTIRTDARDVFLDVDMAIPCGLILNELITNALKHAFPEGKKGEITISTRSDKDRIVLTVTDNGAGFPEGVDFRNTPSLGLQLVNVLVKQIRGTIVKETDRGTTFIISFPTKVHWNEE